MIILSRGLLHCLLMLTILLFDACSLFQHIEENQGKQEIKWAKQWFRKNYYWQYHQRFSGDIDVKSPAEIWFGNKVLHVSCDSIYLPIFTEGILYPQLFIGWLSNIESKQAASNLRYFKPLDSFHISHLEELHYLHNTAKVRRFRFLNFRPRNMNPTVYLLELTNKKATKKTTLAEFIKGATLTYVKPAWVML